MLPSPIGGDAWKSDARTMLTPQSDPRWSYHRRPLHQDSQLRPDPRFLGWYRHEYRMLSPLSHIEIVLTLLKPEGDSGGELDPHGPDAVGNPIGGNVTSDVSGEDVFYEEVSRTLLLEQRSVN